MSGTVRQPMGRRVVVRTAAVTAILLAVSGWITTAQSDQGMLAADFVRRSGNELAALANAAASEEGRVRMQAFIDRVADVDGVARFCLGRFWAAASNDQRRTYLALFHRVLTHDVTSWLGNHRQDAAHVTIGRPRAAGDGIDVPTIVERGADAPAHVTWVVTTSAGDPKIVDLVVEGVSMRLTVRNDYASFVEHNNGSIEALIEALERQAASG